MGVMRSGKVRHGDREIGRRMSIASTLRFRWPWRDYQTRVLKVLDGHLTDRRLHIVAAPGAGKTVLGLEVFRRLDRPTLVLSPTRTIRDQWVDRLRDFLPAGVDPFAQPWQSRDLAAPAFFTSLTYQALHARVRTQVDGGEDAECEAPESEADDDSPSEADIDIIADAMKAAGIAVLILDEAHHLRAEWWSALQALVRRLADVTVVSLTATPPYDVVGQEWNRYVELCGPIDEEISVPELVRAGTLCPHQDYVWLVRCESGEANRLREHRASVVRLLNELSIDAQFLEDCRAHAWATAPDAHVAALIEFPREATALCAFLHRAGHEPQALMRAADLQPPDLPPMDENAWQHLLRLYLFEEGWPDNTDCGERRQRLARRLRAEDLLWKRELSLVDTGRRWPRLTLDAGKADACVEIHQLEARVRGEQLRQVILTDYIRDEDYAQPVQGRSSLGAWPVFFRLVGGASTCPRSALALHTGRLSIVHRDVLDALRALPESPELQVRDVPALSDYVEVRPLGEHRLTRAFTRLLVEGRVQVLVGTRALLGEGWDAPPVNSLVLASAIGSFMTTNQMRGRAIRTDHAQPDKVASIWHLGAVARITENAWDLRDLDEMRARFAIFVGLAHERDVIEGGLARLRPGFLQGEAFRLPIDETVENKQMSSRLLALSDVARRWHAAVDGEGAHIVVPCADVPEPPRFNPLDFRGTLAVLLFQVLVIAIGVFVAMLQTIGPRSANASGVLTILLLAVGMAFVATLPRLGRIVRLWFNYLPVDGSVRAIAFALRDALCECALLPARLRMVEVKVGKRGDGGVYVALDGGTLAERALFADCLVQVLGPIDYPRYVITRRLARRVGRELDYHAVPAILGARVERAQAFLQAWERHVSVAQLHYTRNDAGRTILLRARLRAFANASRRVASRMDRWL